MLRIRGGRSPALATLLSASDFPPIALVNPLSTVDNRDLLPWIRYTDLPPLYVYTEEKQPHDTETAFLKSGRQSILDTH